MINEISTGWSPNCVEGRLFDPPACSDFLSLYTSSPDFLLRLLRPLEVAALYRRKYRSYISCWNSKSVHV